jgi:hypothetical protein
LPAGITLIDIAEEAEDVLGVDIWRILSRKNKVSIKLTTAGDLFNHQNVYENQLTFTTLA